MIYAWRHPASVHRSVMIGVNPPGNFLWSGDDRRADPPLRRRVPADEHCSRQTGDLAALLKETHVPKSWLHLPIRSGNVRVASFYGLMESVRGRADLCPDDARLLDLRRPRRPERFVVPVAARRRRLPRVLRLGRAGGNRAHRRGGRQAVLLAPRARRRDLGNPGTGFVWADGRLADAWPAAPDENEYSRVRRSSVETLLIGGALDVATPPQITRRELLPSLPNGHQVVLPGFGHTTSFWTEQPKAGTQLVNTFFDSGRVDHSLYKPERVDFTPEVTQTALGKGFAAAIAGLALLTLASLAWMAVRRRRHGRAMSIALRAAYPVVLGFGGWFLAVLVTLKWFPGTPLDDELLSVVSIGLPIGLGVYFGWLGDERRAAGLVAALAGALVGGWLGFNVADGLLALVTTIAACDGGVEPGPHPAGCGAGSRAPRCAGHRAMRQGAGGPRLEGPARRGPPGSGLPCSGPAAADRAAHDRSPLRHHHPAVARHARRHRAGGRRRRAEARGSDRARARGARGRSARPGGGRLPANGDDGQPDRAARARPARRRAARPRVLAHPALRARRPGRPLGPRDARPPRRVWSP